MVSVLDLEYVTGIFDDHVLKSAASAQARNSVHSRLANRPKGIPYILVGASWGNPYTGVLFEQ